MSAHTRSADSSQEYFYLILGRQPERGEIMVENHDRTLLPPCGLYCGVCGVFIASRENNHKFKERLSTVYDVSPNQISCKGCLSDDVFDQCKSCRIKTCARERKHEACHQCTDFPCNHITEFPYLVGRKVMLRALPQWRELGTEKWVEEEIKRYICHNCGHQLFRGAKRCNHCLQSVDQD